MAGTETQREDDEPSERASGAVRLSGLLIRTALQQTYGTRAEGLPAESETERLEGVFRTGESVESIKPDVRISRIRRPPGAELVLLPALQDRNKNYVA